MQINQNWKRQFLILVDLNVSNAKISEIESKIPSISGLATNTALTAIENKITNISSLVKKQTNQILIQKLLILKRNLLIIIMTHILLLQNLISLQQKFLM